MPTHRPHPILPFFCALSLGSSLAIFTGCESKPKAAEGYVSRPAPPTAAQQAPLQSQSQSQSQPQAQSPANVNTSARPTSASQTAASIASDDPFDDSDEETSLVGDLILSFGPRSGASLIDEAVYPFNADIRRSAVAQLIHHLYGDSNTALRTYRLLLGAAGDPPSIQFQADPDPTVRAIAARALGIHGIPADASVLTHHLTDSSPVVRLEAATALQKLHDTKAIDDLTYRLLGNPIATTTFEQDPDEEADVRAASALALGQYPQTRVFNALVTGLFDQDFAVVAACHQSLITITGQKQFDTSPDTWLDYSRAQGNQLFKNTLPYLYEPFPQPPSFFESLQFWKTHEPPAPETPKGLVRS